MFSAFERNFIFSTIEKCRCSYTAQQLEEIVTYFVGSFIPHKMSVCGIGGIEANTHTHRLDFGCPAGMLDKMLPTLCAKNNFLLPLWKQNQAPLYKVISESGDDELTAEQNEWRQLLVVHDVRNVAMHGFLDMARGVASFFYFGRLAEPLSAQQAEIFSMLVPHLHSVLLRVTELSPATPARIAEKSFAPAESKRGAERPAWGLTRRESEILKWIYYGKTNSETARILGISELTVRNHMQNLMLKLGVGNRTQAVVKAMQNNIFDDERTLPN